MLGARRSHHSRKNFKHFELNKPPDHKSSLAKQFYLREVVQLSLAHLALALNLGLVCCHSSLLLHPLNNTPFPMYLICQGLTTKVPMPYQSPKRSFYFFLLPFPSYKHFLSLEISFTVFPPNLFEFIIYILHMNKTIGHCLVYPYLSIKFHTLVPDRSTLIFFNGMAIDH